jgi:hypothetical protein
MAAVLAVKAQHDIYVNLQSSEQRNQLINRESGNVAVHKLRDIRLLETKLPCRLHLRESKGCGAIVALTSQLCLYLQCVGVGKIEISKDVAAALHHWNIVCVERCHSS